VVSLEQVRALEDRVEKAVAYIGSLREEGAELRRRLAEAQSFIDEAGEELAAAEEKVLAAEKRADSAQSMRDADAEKIRELESRLGDMAQRVAAAETRAAELSARAEEYRKDQAKIEEGIVHALEKLDSFEDLVLAQASPPAAEEPTAEAAEEPAAKAGIAVKAAPDLEAESGSEGASTLENELDIF
jgi:chromosome segregation ATPase